MGRYLFKVSYSVAGLQGVMKEGAEHRVAFIAKLYEDGGGSMASFDFALGETDAYVIGELPDDETAAAHGSDRDREVADPGPGRPGAGDADGVSTARGVARPRSILCNRLGGGLDQGPP
jgi:GYD domain